MIDSERLAIYSDQELVSMTINEIAEFAPRAQRAQLVHREVLRLPLAVSRPVPGSERHRPPAVTRLPRVFLAGDWTRTRLPGSLDSAARSGAPGGRARARGGRPAAPARCIPAPAGKRAAPSHRSARSASLMAP